MIATEPFVSAAPEPDAWPIPAGGRVAVVFNPKSGSLLAHDDARAVIAGPLAATGLTVTMIPVEAGDLPTRISMAVGSGAAMVVVAGGDGTVACAAQALAGTRVVLGILPFGTMNLLAKDLRIPLDDLPAAVQVLTTGIVRDIDVAEVNGRAFLCASMLGLPARLGRHREAHREGRSAIGRWIRFARAALRALRRPHAGRLLLTMGGRTRQVYADSLTVTANALDDSTGRSSGQMFGRARLDGGELAVYIVDQLGVLQLLRLATALLRGGWRRNGTIREYRMPELVLQARHALRVMNDGEGMLLQPPLLYRIRPRALRVVAPALPSGAGR